MFVIFWIEEKKYYTNNPQCHWSEEIDLALSFKNRVSAENLIRTNLKDKVDLVKIVDKENINISFYTKEEAEQAYDELQKAVQIFGAAMEKMPAIRKYYEDIQSEQDRLQQDLLHKFEFVTPGNIIFVKLGRMLKICRIKRREAKDKLSYLTAIDSAKPEDILKAHNNHIRLIETRKYAPRIATELFE